MKFRCKDSDHMWKYIKDSGSQSVTRVCTKCKYKQCKIVGRTGPESKCWITAEV